MVTGSFSYSANGSGSTGQFGYTQVKEAVRELKRTSREKFVPLAHAPGETQMDFVAGAGFEPATSMYPSLGACRTTNTSNGVCVVEVPKPSVENTAMFFCGHWFEIAGKTPEKWCFMASPSGLCQNSLMCGIYLIGAPSNGCSNEKGQVRVLEALKLKHKDHTTLQVYPRTVVLLADGQPYECRDSNEPCSN